MGAYGTNYTYGYSTYKDEGAYTYTAKHLKDSYINWGGGFSVKYKFVTPIFISEQGKEQRTALRSLPTREISYSCLETAGITEKLINDLRSSSFHALDIPIYCERIKTTNTGSLQGLNKVDTENTAKLYNYRNLCGGVILVDRLGVLEPEILQLCTVSTGVKYIYDTYFTLRTGHTITQAFLAASTDIFPIATCFFSGADFSVETDNLINTNLTYSEEKLWLTRF